MSAESAAAHESHINTLVRLAQRDLTAFWATIEHESPLQIAAVMREVLRALVGKYGEAAAELGATWYEQQREAAGAPGRYNVQLAPLPEDAQLAATAGWAISPIFSQSPNTVQALAQLAGGLQRYVAGGDRNTLRQNVLADPAQPTYTRIAQANGCAFCKMLATRGAVYTSAEHAGFGQAEYAAHYHDDCRCHIDVQWGSEPVHSPDVDQWTAAYTDATTALGGASDTKQILSLMRVSLGSH